MGPHKENKQVRETDEQGYKDNDNIAQSLITAYSGSSIHFLLYKV